MENYSLLLFLTFCACGSRKTETVPPTPPAFKYKDKREYPPAPPPQRELKLTSFDCALCRAVCAATLFCIIASRISALGAHERLGQACFAPGVFSELSLKLPSLSSFSPSSISYMRSRNSCGVNDTVQDTQERTLFEQ